MIFAHLDACHVKDPLYSRMFILTVVFTPDGTEMLPQLDRCLHYNSKRRGRLTGSVSRVQPVRSPWEEKDPNLYSTACQILHCARKLVTEGPGKYKDMISTLESSILIPGRFPMPVQQKVMLQGSDQANVVPSPCSFHRTTPCTLGD